MTESSLPEDDQERDDAAIGVALKWSLIVFLLLLVIVAPIAFLLMKQEEVAEVKESELAEVEIREVSEVQPPSVTFKDITEAAGIDFVHESGARGQKLLPETMGGGAAFFDFDNDGDQDLLLVNSQTWEEFAGETIEAPSIMGLYANDGSGNFENVTAGSGLDVSMYGMGIACGDYNGDGLVDVYISAVGKNRLFQNIGEGKFQDVTDVANIGGAEDEWGTSCGWFDYDKDGDLDLFVCNYVKWSSEYDLAQNFQLTGGERAYGRPQNFEGTFPYLFRNEGNGTFTEVAEAAGLHMSNLATDVPMAKSLGVTFEDYNGDDWLDVLVANDTVQNFLFVNKQDGTFEEMGTISGVAFDMNGAARGAMGIDTARFRNNDSLGVAIGNFSNEMTALYVSSENQAQFVDEAISCGLGPTTRLSLTFGLFFFDYDFDGRLDIFASNGHLEKDINRVQSSQYYEQPPQLFWNCGAQADTEFQLAEEELVGEELTRPLVGRGSCYADIDGDGDLDVLIATTGQKPRLLRNDQQLNHNWIRFDLQGQGANSQAIGTLVEIDLGETTLRRRVSPTKSYLSQSELSISFGLGEAKEVDEVRIIWPNGTTQTIEEIEVNQSHRVEQPITVGYGYPAELQKWQHQLKALNLERSFHLAHLSWLDSQSIEELRIQTYDGELSQIAKLKRLKKLDLTIAKRVEDLRPLTELVDLKQLTLRIYGSEVRSIAPLRELDQLEELTLLINGSQIHDLAPLTGLVNLKQLSLYISNRDIHSASFLGGLQKLDSLTLDVAGSALMELSELERLTSLKRLSLDLSGSHVKELASLGMLSGLEEFELKLDGSEVNNLSFLKNLAGLKTLTLELGSSRSFKDLAPLSQLPELVELNLSFGAGSDIDLSAISKLSQLKHLSTDIIETRSTPVNLGFLQGLKQLNSLSLRIACSHLDHLNEIGSLMNLESLQIDFMESRVSDLSPITKLKRLKHLDLTLNGFQGDNLKSIGTLSELTSLSLFVKGKAITSLAPITNLKQLRMLQLALWTAVVEDINELSGLKHLEDLSVEIFFVPNGHGLTPSSVDFINNLGQLKTLRLKLHDPKERSLRALSGLDSLEELELYLHGVHFENSTWPKKMTALKTLCWNIEHSDPDDLAIFDYLPQSLKQLEFYGAPNPKLAHVHTIPDDVAELRFSGRPQKR